MRLWRRAATPETGDYRYLSLDEQDDMIVATMMAQERDLFIHELNLERFRTIAASALPPMPLRENVESQIPVLESRIIETRAIIAALEPQMPPPERAHAAWARLRAAVAPRRKAPE